MSYCIKFLKVGLLSVILFVMLPAFSVIQKDADASIDPGDNIKYNKDVPQLHFAASEIQKAFDETKKRDLTVELKIASNASLPAEGFEIKRDKHSRRFKLEKYSTLWWS